MAKARHDENISKLPELLRKRKDGRTATLQ
jgi:hypothetical protein